MTFTPQFQLCNMSEVQEGDLMLIFSEKEGLMASRKASPVPHDFLIPGSERNLPEPTQLFRLGTGCTEEREISLFCGSLEGKEVPLPEGWLWHSFNDVFRDIPREEQFPFSRARQILGWERTNRYCGSCGSKTELEREESCRRCPECGAFYYPSFAPAVIVLITRGEELLLAHNVNFPEGLYSHIAGFVETGESLEDAVRREVMEEVSLNVKNIRYFDSQQWPMPRSLMLGFTAECPEGEPVPDGVEILDAQWFGADNLPVLPPQGSIARRMIDDFLGEL
ncbi:MAG: NAD(+) diphosphatase [Spirochaetales bacterium]|nr:NAD(+) diphosphatase [Spirochaetales bacterium]